ncbi:hypothetical protein [Pseudonocardia alaniniphila]|uniref:Transcriptional regulator n=1 Tax=Pseudonocardia alaniniphila TaxID=75291 RepID=A0ABS9T926_9PSEU|nr:hypothetical protein [Pseudonocardia alaniniphila]MCH6165044.1 hypothetical protein [Pseudonocardia alaniniphila]
MTGYTAWNEIRAEHVARAGGEAAVEAGKREMLAEVDGPVEEPRPRRPHTVSDDAVRG